MRAPGNGNILLWVHWCNTLLRCFKGYMMMTTLLQEEFSKAIKDATPASYAIAKAFAQMKGAKYFAVSGAGKGEPGALQANKCCRLHMDCLIRWLAPCQRRFCQHHHTV